MNRNKTSAARHLLTLHNRQFSLDIAPAVGGSIARFYTDANGTRHHWLRPATDEDVINGKTEGMASFPLVPFCNRLRNGRAQFKDRHIQLPPNRGNSPHAIHGIGWQRPWSVLEHDARSALLEIEHDEADWPYRFRATQHYVLDRDRLSVTIDVENRGSSAMPLGIGHHPYFPDRKNARLTVSLDSMWETDSEVMPTSLTHPALIEQLRDGLRLENVVQDNNFIGWNHVACVDWPSVNGADGSRGITLRAEAPLDFFVLYSPSEHDFFCIEPVSNCTDWLNLGGYAREQIGGNVIAPGVTCRANFSLTPHWGE